MNKGTTLKRNPEVLGSQINNEVVLFDDRSGTYFGMNRVGSKIWELLESPKSVSELLTALQAVFNVSEENCEKDIMPFLSQLTTKGLIEASN